MTHFGKPKEDQLEGQKKTPSPKNVRSPKKQWYYPAKKNFFNQKKTEK